MGRPCGEKDRMGYSNDNIEDGSERMRYIVMTTLKMEVRE